MSSRYQAFYFEDLPITRLSTLNFDHMNFNGTKTGGMPLEEFNALKDDIRKNGLINPIVVEVDSGYPPRFRIAMGNNRVEAWKQLGHDTIKALVICKVHPPPIQDLGEYECINLEKLETFMANKHPGDTLWKKSLWASRMLKATG